MSTTTRLQEINTLKPPVVTFGVCASGDPRIDQASRERAGNIVHTIAEVIAAHVRMPDGRPVHVVWTPMLIDGEKPADLVAQQFTDAGVQAIVCAPDTWAFPQPSILSLLAHFAKDIPVNITCGNSAPRPGVVYAQALNGALAQSGRLTHLNVGSWPDADQDPRPSAQTVKALVDWCYAALTFVGLRGRRVVVFGSDSMGIETGLSHVLPTRHTFGLESARLDLKLVDDLLRKEAYDKKELAALRAWIDQLIGKRLDLSQPDASAKFNKSLAMYLIIRDLLRELHAVGGAFKNMLEWGSDLQHGIPQPTADLAESLLNSSFDHNGPKTPIPFATETDIQGLLTMLASHWLTGGNPPLFMDFRKAWPARELQELAGSLGVPYTAEDAWAQRGIVDGDNSGSASLDWAGKPGASVEEIMSRVTLPSADPFFFPGGGNSVTFISPGGIPGIAARMAYCELNGMFSLVWDEACTVDLPEKLAAAVASSSNPAWPHTWVVPKYATTTEYIQYAPGGHFHMIRELEVARLQCWMDLTNVLSVTPWQARPAFIDGIDRPLPLLYQLMGGENVTKQRRAK